MREVEFVKDDLGHYADASPKVTQGVAKVLSANRTIDRWASRVFFLHWSWLSIAALHSSVSLTTSVVGSGRLLLMMSLML